MATMRWSSWLMIGPSREKAIAMVMKVWFINWHTGDPFSREKPDLFLATRLAGRLWSSMVNPDADDDIGRRRLGVITRYFLA